VSRPQVASSIPETGDQRLVDEIGHEVLHAERPALRHQLGRARPRFNGADADARAKSSKNDAIISSGLSKRRPMQRRPASEKSSRFSSQGAARFEDLVMTIRSIRRWHGWFVSLKATAADFRRRIRGIEILSEEERRRLTVAYNYTLHVPLSAVRELFAVQVRLTPDNVAALHEPGHGVRA